MLTELQRTVAALLRDLPEANDFVIAGGAALILHGDLDRVTRDLDYFTIDADSVDRLVPALDRAARAAGLGVTIRQRPTGSPGCLSPTPETRPASTSPRMPGFFRPSRASSG